MSEGTLRTDMQVTAPKIEISKVRRCLRMYEIPAKNAEVVMPTACAT